jgi:predicted permease
MRIDSGFHAEQVLTFRVAPPVGRYADSLRYSQFFMPILERIRALPGVRAAGLTNVLPIEDGTTDRYFSIVGQPFDDSPERRPDAEFRIVTGDYFKALGIPLVSGRGFQSTDAPASEPVALINEELRKKYFAGEDPVGHQLDMGAAPFRIVGVVKSVRQVGLDQAIRPEFYLPATQASREMGTMAIVISASGDLQRVAAGARQAVRDVAPHQPIYQVMTMTNVVESSVATRRLLLELLGGFAGLALVLSAAGVYGVMSYGVTQRRREIGIRIALGARFADVTGMVLRDVGRVASVGIAIGIGASLLLTRALGSVLYGVSALDLLSFSVAPAIILCVAMIAGAVPALRAARVDPLLAMRAE